MARSVVTRRLVWQHDGFLSLSDLERQVALYVRDGPQTNLIGLHTVNVDEMADTLRRDRALVRASWSVVRQAVGWQWDESARVVYQPGWWSWNPSPSPALFKKMVVAAFGAMPATPLQTAFLNNRRHLAERCWPVLDAVLNHQSTGGDAKALTLLGHPGIDAPDTESEVFRRVAALWNEIVTAPIPKVSLNGTSYRRQVYRRWQSFDRLELWRVAITELNATPWCRGEQSSMPDYVANLKLLVKSDESFQRFLDDGYRRQRTTGSSSVVAGCTHTPPCTSRSACTQKTISED